MMSRFYWFWSRYKGPYALDYSVFPGGDAKIIGCPDDTLDGSLMSEAVGVFQKIWRGIGPVNVKNPDLFLLTAGKEMRGCW